MAAHKGRKRVKYSRAQLLGGHMQSRTNNVNSKYKKKQNLTITY